MSLLDAPVREAGDPPPAPITLHRLEALAASGLPDIEAMLDAVRHDPGLTVSLLRYANNTTGAGGAVGSLEAARRRLGTGIALAVALDVVAREAELPAHLDDLRLHAALAAAAAREIARRVGQSADDAHTAALLHDVVRWSPAARAVGSARLARRWRLPAHVADAIEHHPDPERAHGGLADVVHVAHALAERLDGRPAVIASGVLHRLGLTPPGLVEVERVVAERSPELV